MKSVEELDKKIERLYKTMKDQNKGAVREKAAKLPEDCCLGLIRAGQRLFTMLAHTHITVLVREHE